MDQTLERVDIYVALAERIRPLLPALLAGS
jgi:hypothetical protein